MGFWEITKKDLKLLVRDRRTTALLVVLPLVFITIIGATTGKLLGWKRSNQVLRIGYLDSVDYMAVNTPFDDELYPEEEAAERVRVKNLISRIINGLQEGEGVELYPAKDREELDKMMDGQVTEEVNVGLVFGPDFYEKLQALGPGDIFGGTKNGRLKDGLPSLSIELVSDQPNSSSYTIVERLVMGEVVRQVAPSVFCRGGLPRGFANSNKDENDEGICDRITKEGFRPPIERLTPKQDKSTQSKDNRMYNELVPGWTVMFVFFLVNIMARSFIHERDLGTLRRLRIAPVNPTGVILGKTVPFYIISIVQTSLLFLAGLVIFEMDWGQEPWLLIPIILSTSLAATTLGLMVATLVKTEAQVSAYANFVVIVMAGISGCFLPRDWLPEMMQTISLGTPHAWALKSYREALTTSVPRYGYIFECCGMMVAFSLLFFSIGVWRFRHVE
ncbi:MAG: ABC transporter permease [Planctomycetaceae bacterium]|nr:ABC transporter permease [Planctomycetaceae bacterium]